MKTSLALVFSAAALLVAVPGCKKKNKNADVTATGSGMAGSGMTGSDMGSAGMATGSDMAGSGMAGSGMAGSGSGMAGSGSDTAMAGSGSADQGSAAAAKLTDVQIAGIVVAANKVDIDAGNLALKKSKNAEVKKFAKQMVTDHTAVNKAAGELVTKLKINPEESDASKALHQGGTDNLANLEKLDGAAFDKAYVDNEVAYHMAVMSVLDTQLIPSATNEELKKMLVGVKPAFDAHLKHAQSVQSTMAGGAGSAAHDHK